MRRLHSPAAESARLEALAAYGVLNSTPEPHFDALALLAARACAAPMASIAFTGAQTVYFKARVGLAVATIPRALCMTSVAMADADADAIAIEDARLHAGLALHPRVAGQPGIRFFAAVALWDSRGHELGSLVVADVRPHAADPAAMDTLQVLGEQIVMQLEHRRELLAARRALDQATREATNVIDDQERLTFASSSWSALSGHAPAACLGADLESLFAADDRPNLRNALRRARIGQPGNCDARLLLRDAGLRWVQITLESARDGRSLTGRLVDISRARQAELLHEAHVRELRRQETLMERTQSAARIGGWEIDLADGSLAWTREAYRIHGLAPDSPPPSLETLLRAYAPSCQRSLRAALTAARIEGVPFDLELELKLPSGQRRWIRHTGEREARADNRRWLVGTLQDVTERRHLERAVLAAAQAERESLARDLHDGLAQELTGVSIMLRALTSRIRALDQGGGAELDEVTRLVAASLDTCRALAHGIAPVSPTRGGLRAALTRLCERAAQLRRIAVRCEASVEPGVVISEVVADDLFLIAQESINNAGRHGRANHIAVRLALTQDGGTLSITDDGVGIDFEATDAGMGLRIMRYRARRIGGKLEVTRRAAGGTVVTCRLERPMTEPERDTPEPGGTDARFDTTVP